MHHHIPHNCQPTALQPKFTKQFSTAGLQNTWSRQMGRMHGTWFCFSDGEEVRLSNRASCRWFRPASPRSARMVGLPLGPARPPDSKARGTRDAAHGREVREERRVGAAEKGVADGKMAKRRRRNSEGPRQSIYFVRIPSSDQTRGKVSVECHRHTAAQQGLNEDSEEHQHRMLRATCTKDMTQGGCVDLEERGCVDPLWRLTSDTWHLFTKVVKLDRSLSRNSK